MADEAKRPLKVFLCHASGDKLPVREMYKRLVAEGVDAWLDQEKLMPGQDWQLEIPGAVREADVVVVFLSHKSITKEGYIQKEIRFALDSADEKPEGSIFLIPARLEDCEVPPRLSRWQWVDLFEEHGFARLLGSLKLRAGKVGATIEPPGEESEDQEIERKLDQLYTEGLAAFYTEDWDRAYQRFQAILRERPTHKNAAEKLVQAERQRNFVKLYARGTEAYQAEDWLVAIQALEELLGKAGEYKDAVPLLKDAKRQKQLKELYAEAKRLHSAKKWQAVLRVFDQISAVDPAYSDPEGLLPSAHKEAAELKRLAELNDLYRQGIHKMDAGEWYEARDLLEQVHKAQTSFMDSERLLRKIQNEILRIEEKRTRDAQVQMFYEQARKMRRAGQWGKALAQMEEIQKLDNQFTDTDGILEKSKAELAREEQEAQRRSELAALYAEAVSLLEAKKYQEALETWNVIQAIDPKYKDTARVKATARRKLDELSRPEGAGRPWTKLITDWFSAEANIPTEHQLLSERLLLVSFAVIIILRLLWGIFPKLFPNLLNWQLNPVAVAIYLTPIAGFYGAVLAFALSKVMLDWHRKSSLALIAGWTLGLGIPFILFAVHVVGEDAFIVYRLLTSLSVAVAIKWARPATSPMTLILVFVSWVLVWRVTAPLSDHLMRLFNADYVAALVDGVLILFGLLFTFGLQVESSWEVLKTALFGALGFAVGNFLLDIIGPLLTIPIEITFALWGLIGGAILEVPSRNSRRILSSAAICGFGFLVGSYVAFDLHPAITGQYANSGFAARYAILRQIALGTGLGLAFGSFIRRISAIVVLALLGAGVFMVTSVLFSREFSDISSIPDAVRGALIGFVLGYGYAYMRTGNPLESKLLTARTKFVWPAIIGLLAIAIPFVIWLSRPAPLTPYRWNFDSGTQGWGSPGKYADVTVPKIKDGQLTFTSTGNDPYIFSHAALRIFASTTPVITIRMRVTQGQGPDAQIFFITNEDNNWDETKSVVFSLDQDGAFGTYNVLMSESPAWQGVITEIRLDPANAPRKTNIQFAIDYISVHAP
jgi:outer membrane protein assembly factor BamD (BamD/ComL family)